MELLGEILLRKKLVEEDALTQALFIQKQTGSRLGDILISRGAIDYFKLYGAVAEFHALPFVDLLKTPPDATLLDEKKAAYYLGLRAMPWKRENGVTTVAICDLRDEVMQWAQKNYGDNTKFAITSPFDIRRTVEDRFGLSLEKFSRLSLWTSKPEQSARYTLHGRQKIILPVITALCFALALLSPSPVLIGLFIFCHIAYFISMAFKCGLFALEAHNASLAPDWANILPHMRDSYLPTYTLLIPMYKETASVSSIAQAIKSLDYPREKLDIKLVIEEDDAETLQAIRSARLDYQFDIIRVPPGTPRTKPRACNYALRFAKGDYITIYDADDRPDPQQLKKAVYMFSILPREVICLQSRLNYYNTNQNLLTRLFSLEYTILFNYQLYGLERLGIPIPLGGTSNHIIRSRLEELGEWDPYNVTEDADLGTRLSARGFKTAMLDSDTMEEAPLHLGAWIRQRSRWIKGYMQTWLVYMRHPLSLYRTLGFRGFVGFQCFIGLSCFTFLTAPVVWGMSYIWFASNLPASHTAWADLFLYFVAINLGLNVASCWYASFFSLRQYKNAPFGMLLAALGYPLYMVLHSIASYKSLWQLIVKPHFWEKTMHGVGVADTSPIIPLTEAPIIGYKAPSFSEKVLDMKVLSSLKSAKKRDKDCRVVRRKGRVYVINKKNPRFKARQG